MGFDQFTYPRTQVPDAPVYSQANTVYFDTPSNTIERSSMPRFLDSILPYLTSATHIYITRYAEQILIEAIKRVKAAYFNALPSLRAVYGYNANGSVLVYEEPVLTDQDD
ncbi:hypothetical protein CPB86DRAFT_788254 [Serendipita vermifera]|nr:hypothetical protein CPB86DRAFT_788254 [Serendipita vermifera]